MKQKQALTLLRPYFRFCPACGLELAPECTEDDPCIVDCPGVDDACCGHGIDEAAYAAKDGNMIVKGFEAVLFLKRMMISKRG